MASRLLLALIITAGFLSLPEQAIAQNTNSTSTQILDVLRGLLGIITVVGIGYLLSENRKKINWSLIGKGLVFQFIIAILVLKVPWVEVAFDWLSRAFVKITSFADYGVDFLIESYVTDQVEPALVNFLFTVLPIIIFFSALSALLYHLGIMQRIVKAFAWVMRRTLSLSGAESLSAAGNIFLGQTESPLLIRPLLSKISRSEMMCVMSGGMATIAGSVLASYIGFLGGDDPEQKVLFARHLLTASIMSAPAAVVASKLIVPEISKVDTSMKAMEKSPASNVLEAILNGTTDGIKLAVNVAAMLLVFTAFIYFGNYILGDFFGQYTGLNGLIEENTPYDKLSFQMIVGYVGAPIAWLMGANSEDLLLVGQLLGEKTILNEFIAYVSLGEMKEAGAFASDKSMIIATYILCGFANFASIGIQVGGIGALVPERKGLLAQLGFKALIAGTMACLFTAALVGMLL